ncbi:MAG: ribonuclease P protein component [Chloroflexi bacterium]|nr:ribonuclease P protein component [Chloroflexota bacterium]
MGIPRERRLRSEKDLARVRAEGRSVSAAALTLWYCVNALSASRVAFVASRRLGKATARNRVKRLLREAVRQEEVKPGWDLIFSARPLMAEATFHQAKNAVRDLLRRAGLLGRESAAIHPSGDGQERK